MKTTPTTKLATTLEKLETRSRTITSMLCIGLDSDYDRIPVKFKENPQPQLTFNRWLIDQTAEFACAFKFNSAFYEARGEKGLSELAASITYLHETYPDCSAIVDAKRADIDSTNQGYAAYVYSYLKADAITLHPYLGGKTLLPLLLPEKLAFVLCHTSNPGAGELQDLELKSGEFLWQHLAKAVTTQWQTLGPCGLVMGATYPEELAQARKIAPETIFLVPGVGTQGGSLTEVLKAGQRSNGFGMVINVGRNVIFSSDPHEIAKNLWQEQQPFLSLQ